MIPKTQFQFVVPVLPSRDIERDVQWYQEKTGFEKIFADDRYAILRREEVYLHLQWHAGTPEDPVGEGSVIRIFVKNIATLFPEFIERGTVTKEKLRKNTPWNTHEFGFYDPNNNAIFIVEDTAG